MSTRILNLSSNNLNEGLKHDARSPTFHSYNDDSTDIATTFMFTLKLSSKRKMVNKSIFPRWSDRNWGPIFVEPKVGKIGQNRGLILG